MNLDRRQEGAIGEYDVLETAVVRRGGVAVVIS